MKMTYSNSLLHLGCVVLVLVFVSGCGGGDTKVDGTVTLPDGSPLTEGVMMFDNGKTNVVGKLDAQGKFALYQFKPGDGVPPGTYRGMIQYEVEVAPELEGEARYAALAKALPFSPKYLELGTSGLTLTVESGKKVAPMNIVLEK